MKETLLLGIVAFVVAIGGGTWFGAFLSPPRVPHAAAVDSGGALKPTSPKAPAAKGGTAPSAKPASGPDRPAGRPDNATGRSTADSANGALPAAATPVPAGAPAGDPKAAKAVGKILVSMKPVQAAKILEKLTDDDIEAIVRQLNAKQVAPLLVALPAERAVAMSRRLLANATKPAGRS